MEEHEGMHVCTKMHLQIRHAYFYEHKCKNVFACICRETPIHNYVCIYVPACLTTYVHTLAHRKA
jgi:hypothetical protein